MSYHLAYNPPRSETWREQAACAGRYDVFFPKDETGDECDEAAKRICRTCPVHNPCLVGALADEGKAPVYARVGVRGGLTALERGRAAGVVAEAENPDFYPELDRVLRLATMRDVEIAQSLGLSITTVHRRRHFLGLPTVRLRGITPQEVYASGARPTEGGHVEWQSNAVNPAVSINGRTKLVARFAFELGHGREPVGPVTRACGYDRCIAWQHLTDRVVREARVTADAA
ncbi:WhiB family transcriptional regulator [Streptomyces sp. NPDC048331]|uniref:WhiB family transcriptional regulator n=1 Tax=Streptomyces sp. NPDC048331 TaxID=3365534 RepID=UPI003714C266